jgi:hypothetical protein
MLTSNRTIASGFHARTDIIRASYRTSIRETMEKTSSPGFGLLFARAVAAGYG